MSELTTVIYLLLSTAHQAGQDLHTALWLVPLIALFEIPLFVLVMIGILRYYHRTFLQPPKASLYKPKVSCVVTCYAEGDAILLTVTTLLEQTYDGDIEIILVVDGAAENKDTYEAAVEATHHQRPQRSIIVLPKWKRGGRVSSCNAGLAIASGELVFALDGDTSFDNDMVARLVPCFEGSNVPAASGALRIRNTSRSIVTRLQSIEYIFSMQGSKTGLAEWNLQSNISGAFGVFRRDVLRQIGGWSTHSAEDLDLTIRLTQYQRRHPGWYIPFEPRAIGHTDVPVTLRDLIKQRLRWDGDLLFMFFRKHWQSFTPKLVGWRHYLYALCYGWIQNVVLPFVIVGYSIYLLITLPLLVVISLLVGIYILYLTILVLFFLFVVIALSERITDDLKLMPWLVVYPLYAFFMRFVACFALLNELVRRSHEESSMAPWWVFKQGGKF